MSEIVVSRFSERYMKCASCRSDARWVVELDGRGPTSCDRHLELWKRRMTAEALEKENPGGNRGSK